ncbi:Ig-like domain-containing protein, partial [Chloroflexota bacterium]
GPIAKSIDGAVYVSGRIGTDNAIFRSDDFGESWERLSDLPTTSNRWVTDLVCSSIDPDMIYVTNGIDIWRTTNAGHTWSILPNMFASLGLEPGLDEDGVITSIDVGYIEENPYVFAATSTFGSGRGDVYMLEEAVFGIPWSSLEIDTDREEEWEDGAADVYTVAVDPSFESTGMIIAIATNITDGPSTYITTRKSSELWDKSGSHISLELDDVPIRQPLRADIWLPWDFDVTDEYVLPLYYASIVSLDPAGGDVFRVLHSEYAEDLDVGFGTSPSITDIDGIGTTSVTVLLAGGDDGTGEPIVFRSTNSGMTWAVSSDPPGGDVWAHVARVSLVLHDEFDSNGSALAATGGFDTGISYTEDGGMTWYHKPVIHSDLKIEFSEPMDRHTTAEAIIIYPEIDYDIFWENDDTLMTIRPLSPWKRSTTYEITVSKDARSRGGEYLEDDYGFTYTTSS